VVVDPIGAKPVSSLDRRVAPVAPGAAAPMVTQVADQHHAAPLADAARDAAKAAPVDQERVASLRASIADGSYNVSPQTIADRLIAAKQEWIDQ
jgi:negative regulator of flagellin synthesis FlgM